MFVTITMGLPIVMALKNRPEAVGKSLWCLFIESIACTN